MPVHAGAEFAEVVLTGSRLVPGISSNGGWGSHEASGLQGRGRVITTDPLGYYRILEISLTASAAEIKSAFRRKAMEYHPDRCTLPNATELFQKVNAAYQVLSDPESRARYDTSTVETTDSAQPAPRGPDPICCSVCGKVSAQPRYVIFYRVVSFLTASRSDPVQGIYCNKCAEKASLKATVFTWALGWWGIPFGPIFTVHALFVNMFGGKRPVDINARILAHQAWYLAAIGRMDVARAVAEQALALALKISPKVAEDGAHLRAQLDAFIASFPLQSPKPRLANAWARLRRPFFIQAGIMTAVMAAIWIYSAQPNASPNYATSPSVPAHYSYTAPVSSPSPTPAFSTPDLSVKPSREATTLRAVTEPAQVTAPAGVRPSVGTDNVLSMAQITYCLAQKIRLDAAQRVLSRYASTDIDRFNTMVDDYNSRCGQYRYEKSSREAAKDAVEPFRAQYDQEGRAWFTPKSPKADVAAALVPVTIRKGVQHVYAGAERIAPFRVTTSVGQNNYFIKLVDASTNSPVMTIYVLGGSTFETRVPLGTYRLRYATGQTWYGTKNLFGPKTGYSEVEDSLTFSVQGDEVQGNDIQLVPQLGGNLATKTISPDEF